jgi:hypothetical protein
LGILETPPRNFNGTAGVTGEGIEVIIKLRWEKLSKQCERTLKLVEFVSWAVVVIGLSLEMREAIKSDKEVVLLESHVEKLRTANDEFEKQQLPMELGEANSFANAVHEAENVNAIVANNKNDEKALKTAHVLEQCLTLGGWHIVNPDERNEYADGIDIRLNPDQKDSNQLPTLAANLLLETLTKRDVPAQITFLAKPPYLPINTLLVVVGERPNPHTERMMILKVRKHEAYENGVVYLKNHPSPTETDKQELNALRDVWIKAIVEYATEQANVASLEDPKANGTFTVSGGDKTTMDVVNGVPTIIEMEPGYFLELKNGTYEFVFQSKSNPAEEIDVTDPLILFSNS